MACCCWHCGIISWARLHLFRQNIPNHRYIFRYAHVISTYSDFPYLLWLFSSTNPIRYVDIRINIFDTCELCSHIQGHKKSNGICCLSTNADRRLYVIRIVSVTTSVVCIWIQSISTVCMTRNQTMDNFNTDTRTRAHERKKPKVDDDN